MKNNLAERIVATTVAFISMGLLVSCQPAPQTRSFTLIAVNDIYRINGINQGAVGGLARLRQLRTTLEKQAPDLLVLHAGDFLFPSTLSRQYKGAQMIDVMNRLDGDAQAFDARLLVTFGNHEFDKPKMKHAPMLNLRIGESQFRWLGSNIEFAKGPDGKPLIDAEQLVPSIIIESGNIKIGIFSLTTDFKTAEYIHNFRDPLVTARKMTALLQVRGAEVVIALTHLLVSQDKALLNALGDKGPDLIIGGHEHLRQFVQVKGRWVLKADADAVSATIVKGTLEPGKPLSIEYEFKRLDETVAKDQVVQARIDHWLSRYDQDYCGGVLKEQPGCLSTVFTKTNTRLVAEELQIRRFETNLGNWVADQALAAFTGKGAQIAFVNSGSLRLNQNIPSGANIMRSHVEDLFAYPSPMKLIRINGAILYKVLAKATEDWTGNGWWLQISGFGFRFDPNSAKVTDVSLLTADGPKPIKPEDELLAVTNDYLITGGDGYTMLNTGQIINDPKPVIDLKQLVIDGLKAAGTHGIAPKVEGRICNKIRSGPCLVTIIK